MLLNYRYEVIVFSFRLKNCRALSASADDEKKIADACKLAFFPTTHVT